MRTGHITTRERGRDTGAQDEDITAALDALLELKSNLIQCTARVGKWLACNCAHNPRMCVIRTAPSAHRVACTRDLKPVSALPSVRGAWIALRPPILFSDENGATGKFQALDW
jgi:hypothetical protein